MFCRWHSAFATELHLSLACLMTGLMLLSMSITHNVYIFISQVLVMGTALGYNDACEFSV